MVEIDIAKHNPLKQPRIPSLDSADTLSPPPTEDGQPRNSILYSGYLHKIGKMFRRGRRYWYELDEVP